MWRGNVAEKRGGCRTCHGMTYEIYYTLPNHTHAGEPSPGTGKSPSLYEFQALGYLNITKVWMVLYGGRYLSHKPFTYSVIFLMEKRCSVIGGRKTCCSNSPAAVQSNCLGESPLKVLQTLLGCGQPVWHKHVRLRLAPAAKVLQIQVRCHLTGSPFPHCLRCCLEG